MEKGLCEIQVYLGESKDTKIKIIPNQMFATNTGVCFNQREKIFTRNMHGFRLYMTMTVKYKYSNVDHPCSKEDTLQYKQLQTCPTGDYDLDVLL